VEWLGEVPAHWSAGRFTRVIQAIKDGTHGTFERVPIGRPLLSAKNVQDGYIHQSDAESQISESDYLSIISNGFPARGDLLLTIVGTIGRSCVYEFDYPLAFQRSVCFIRLCSGNSAKFFFYFTQSKYFQEQLVSRSKSAAQGGIYMGDVVATSLAYPPLDEQAQISIFLDRETAKIDALIAEQQRLIELLKEKRQAVISHAVTKGLNPDAPMKDSGIEWLGEVPADWDVVRLKFVIENVKAGPFGSALTKDNYVSEGYRVYGQEQVIPNDFNIGDYFITPKKFDELSQYSVAPGDLLISCVGTFGKIAVVPDNIEPGIINPRLIRLRCSKTIKTAYLVEVMRSVVTFEQLASFTRGGTMDVINIGTLSEIFIALPPISQQSELIDFINQRAARFDTLTAEAQRAIDLLQERRTALISAAVTGQIDVRPEDERQAA
jgi:type I restriction enzyme S subunit